MLPWRVLLLLFSGLLSASAQVRVSPEWVNTNAMGATTVLLTFGGLRDQVPAEAIWCGEVTDATPDFGRKPVPGTIFGRLPLRYDLSVAGTGGVFTDIMSIPPSVTRRAYQAAEHGERSTFFYVRRFSSTVGGPDEYVVVTCELAVAGARTPFSLTEVQLSFPEQRTVLSLRTGDPVPAVRAAITYTGTGELKGRWELVRPGDELPTDFDLLPEASLPPEERALQRRYTVLERFNVFLPPAGRYVLEGPEASRYPPGMSGLFLVLLRIEAGGDIESESRPVDVGAPGELVIAGGAAGFAIPPLRIYAGVGRYDGSPGVIALLSPLDPGVAEAGRVLEFCWNALDGVAYQRLAIISMNNELVYSALLPGTGTSYRAPPWLGEKIPGSSCFWSVEALDQEGRLIARSQWRSLSFR
jgi:hypothetical protein